MSCTNALPNGEGVLISGLAEDSLCTRRGMLVGQLLLSVQGEVATTHARVVELVDAAADEVRFVFRDCAAEVVLAAAPDRSLCLSLRDHPFGVGAIVTSVSQAGVAARAGIEAEDMLLSIGGTLLRSASEAGALLAADPASPLRVVKRHAERATEKEGCKYVG